MQIGDVTLSPFSKCKVYPLGSSGIDDERHVLSRLLRDRAHPDVPSCRRLCADKPPDELGWSDATSCFTSSSRECRRAFPCCLRGEVHHGAASGEVDGFTAATSAEEVVDRVGTCPWAKERAPGLVGIALVEKTDDSCDVLKPFGVVCVQPRPARPEMQGAALDTKHLG